MYSSIQPYPYPQSTYSFSFIPSHTVSCLILPSSLPTLTVNIKYSPQLYPYAQSIYTVFPSNLTCTYYQHTIFPSMHSRSQWLQTWGMTCIKNPNKQCFWVNFALSANPFLRLPVMYFVRYHLYSFGFFFLKKSLTFKCKSEPGRRGRRSAFT